MTFIGPLQPKPFYETLWERRVLHRLYLLLERQLDLTSHLWNEGGHRISNACDFSTEHVPDRSFFFFTDGRWLVPHSHSDPESTQHVLFWGLSQGQDSALGQGTGSLMENQKSPRGLQHQERAQQLISFQFPQKDPPEEEASHSQHGVAQGTWTVTVFALCALNLSFHCMVLAW